MMKLGVDEVGVDEVGVDEVGVDEMGSRRSWNKPFFHILYILS